MQYSTSSESYSIKDTPSKWKKDDDGYFYKKAAYQHSHSGLNRSTNTNIEQLDALLEDLRNERQHSREYDSTITSSNFGSLNLAKPEKVYRKADDLHHFKEIQNISKSDFNSEVTQTYSRQRVAEAEGNRLKNLSEGAVISHQFTESLKPELHLEDKLTDDILPLPGTKVTTTVRTYTYEIPLNTNTLSRTEQFISNRNNNTKTYEPGMLTIKTESTATSNKNNERPVVSYRAYEIQENELNDVKTEQFHEKGNKINYYQPVHTMENVVYSKTQKNRDYPEIVNYHTNAFNSEHSSSNPKLPSQNNFYHKEAVNSIKTFKDGRGVGTSSFNEPLKFPETKNHTIINEFSSRTSTTNREENLPQKISPFPIGTTDFPALNNSPQKVDELMQSFGNADAIDNSEINLHRKREVETAVATTNQHFIPTQNKPGIEVYYPPGHEVTLTKREERGAAYAEGGRWAKSSGMYEYESGYKTKSKTKTGGAMVPVCLPLCCAMPCSIM